MLSLLELFFKIEERGGQATLAVTTDSGKTKIKFEVASPSTTFGTGSMPTSSAAPQPAPGKRKRSGAARRKAKLRAAAHQATLAAAAGAVLVPPPPSPPSASSPPRPPRPLHHLLSPSPSSRRRRVMPLGRVAGLGRLSAGAKMAMKPFVKRVFTIFATNASFLRVISNFRI